MCSVSDVSFRYCLSIQSMDFCTSSSDVKSQIKSAHPLLRVTLCLNEYLKLYHSLETRILIKANFNINNILIEEPNKSYSDRYYIQEILIDRSLVD